VTYMPKITRDKCGAGWGRVGKCAHKCVTVLFSLIITVLHICHETDQWTSIRKDVDMVGLFLSFLLR